jgi:hypothetical protein
MITNAITANLPKSDVEEEGVCVNCEVYMMRQDRSLERPLRRKNSQQLSISMPDQDRSSIDSCQIRILFREVDGDFNFFVETNTNGT